MPAESKKGARSETLNIDGENGSFTIEVTSIDPLPTVPMPELIPAFDYWSEQEGRRRGYCR